MPGDSDVVEKREDKWYIENIIPDVVEKREDKWYIENIIVFVDREKEAH